MNVTKIYEPGSIARITYRAEDGTLKIGNGIRINQGWRVSTKTGSLHKTVAIHDVDSEGRTPIVLVQPYLEILRDDPAIVRLMEMHANFNASGNVVVSRSSDAAERMHAVKEVIELLRQKTAPPPPDEPTNLGVVVIDANGHRFIRTAEDTRSLPWLLVGDRSPAVFYAWDDFKHPVTIESLGVAF